MGVHILHDTKAEIAALYCSTSGVAFGPLFHDGDDSAGRYHDADERAEAFLRWLGKTDRWWGYERERLLDGSSRRDPRQLTDAGLQKAYSDWLEQEAVQFRDEEDAELAELED